MSVQAYSKTFLFWKTLEKWSLIAVPDPALRAGLVKLLLLGLAPALALTPREAAARLLGPLWPPMTGGVRGADASASAISESSASRRLAF